MQDLSRFVCERRNCFFKQTKLLLSFFLALFFTLLTTVSFASAEEPLSAVEGEFIVSFNENRIQELKNSFKELGLYSDKELQNALIRAIGAQTKEDLGNTGATLIKTTHSSDVDIQTTSDALELGLLEFIEPNFIVQASITPNDTNFSSLWGLHNTGQSGGVADVDIDAPEAWDTTTGDSELVVGVVDTGILYTHPDLASNMWTNPNEIAGNNIDDDGNGVVDDIYGYNAITNSGNPLDDHAHGTHCAGTIAGTGNNSQGVVGVAYSVKLMALKFLSSSGSGSTADAIKSINYAVTMKTEHNVNIRVLSNSWGGGGFSSALQTSIQAANDAGIVFAAAAGNNSSNNDTTPTYPANYNVANVISVAAVDRTGTRASFTNFGASTVHIAAPGVSILSTVLSNGYASYNGTSMATPHVAGVAALVISENSDLTPTQVKSLLMDTSKRLDSLDGKVISGGMVSAANALSGHVNQAPTLEAIEDQDIYRPNGSFSVTLIGADPEDDTLTYSAHTAPVGNESYTLDREYEFEAHYHTDLLGYGEKWIYAPDGWYWIESGGVISKFEWPVEGMTTLAVLGNSVYENPALLTHAVENFEAPASISINGNELTVSLTDSSVDQFEVIARAFDGELGANQSFIVTVLGDDPEESNPPPDEEDSDSDGDGVTDEDEIRDGTDPLDRGSYKARIQSPVNLLWNGFLRMTNIVEIINPQQIPTTVKLTLIDVDGIPHSRTIQVPAEDQMDIILNDFPGFRVDSYGIFRLEFEGALDGRIFFYRTGTTGSDFEFVFSLPFSDPLKGTSSVGFNTFQPSYRPDESDFGVANWLSIVNLDSIERQYSVKTYNQVGSLLAERLVSVQAGKRVDIEGGHTTAGRNVVGMHKIEPKHASAPYLAQLIRYGTSQPFGTLVNRYNFAVPLVAKSGTGRSIHMPISRQFGETNWVEIANTSTQTVNTTVTLYNAFGQSVYSQVLSLAPLSQQHIHATEYLSEGEVGVASVRSGVTDSIVAQSMIYLRRADGSVSSMYAIQASEALESNVAGTFNRYLEMSNYLRVANMSDTDTLVTILVHAPEGVSEYQLPLEGKGSTVLPMHDRNYFRTSSNTYGILTVEASGSAKIYSELVRMRVIGSEIDFAASTAVR